MDVIRKGYSGFYVLAHWPRTFGIETKPFLKVGDRRGYDEACFKSRP